MKGEVSQGQRNYGLISIKEIIRAEDSSSLVVSATSIIEAPYCICAHE
jgi:hypothetical protein